MAKTAYHYLHGAQAFDYDVDAHHAVSRHPKEWKWKPWSDAETRAAHEHHGTEPPPPPSAEEEAELMEDAAQRAEAARIVARADEKEAEKRAEAEKVEAARAKLDSPQPARRPFGRPGAPTEAEQKMLERREAAKREKEGAE